MGPARSRILLPISLLLFSDAAFRSFSDLLLYPPQPVNLSSFLRQIRSLRICLPVPVRMMVPLCLPLCCSCSTSLSASFAPPALPAPFSPIPGFCCLSRPPSSSALTTSSGSPASVCTCSLGQGLSSFPIRCLLCLLSQRASAAGQARRMQVSMIHSGSRSARCRRMRTGILRSSHRGRLPGVPGNAFPEVPS